MDKPVTSKQYYDRHSSFYTNPMYKLTFPRSMADVGEVVMLDKEKITLSQKGDYQIGCDYELGNQLGEGCNAKVYETWDKGTHQCNAVKEYSGNLEIQTILKSIRFMVDLKKKSHFPNAYLLIKSKEKTISVFCKELKGKRLKKLLDTIERIL